MELNYTRYNPVFIKLLLVIYNLLVRLIGGEIKSGNFKKFLKKIGLPSSVNCNKIHTDTDVLLTTADG
ncbi:hypothetical protein SAMN05216464_103116 [Mucilaginibacter pineti]|uniref:Uncharacterized protein n=1 Tax=Mucilaginibacter pineti TaxID=1391627 RepID=A0A1G6YXW6_9SPHI|nr:hypothetical protein SAMN05216464_103116 [Mucilaginibacter pineti]